MCKVSELHPLKKTEGYSKDITVDRPTEIRSIDPHRRLIQGQPTGKATDRPKTPGSIDLHRIRLKATQATKPEIDPIPKDRSIHSPTKSSKTEFQLKFWLKTLNLIRKTRLLSSKTRFADQNHFCFSHSFLHLGDLEERFWNKKNWFNHNFFICEPNWAIFESIPLKFSSSFWFYQRITRSTKVFVLNSHFLNSTFLAKNGNFGFGCVDLGFSEAWYAFIEWF